MRQVRGHQLNFSHPCLAVAPSLKVTKVSDKRGWAQTGCPAFQRKKEGGAFPNSVALPTDLFCRQPYA